MPNKIEEVNHISIDQFHNEILTAGKPLVIRGLVNDWPVVQAGKAGAIEFCNYLKQFDRNYDLSIVCAPSSEEGRIFYNTDMSDLNFEYKEAKLSASLDSLLTHQNDNTSPTLAIQSTIVPKYLPGLERENTLHLLPSSIEPRIWIGGKTTVAAHFDPSENIACCLAGRRKFTLFPPNQVSNLYIGPFEQTPAGAAISLVDFSNPDYEKYPRFKLAESAALQTTLEPGDAIYIPYLWWHHVSALEDINALMNYWWCNNDELKGNPRIALLHAMMSVRDLPPHHRDAWHSLFNHYVFNTQGDPAEHLPESKKGILGKLSINDLKSLRTTIIKILSRLS